MYSMRCGGSEHDPTRSRISRRRSSLRCVGRGRTTTRRVRFVPTSSASRFASSRCSGASGSTRWPSRPWKSATAGRAPTRRCKQQARATVLRALEKIPLKRRAVLVMHDLEEVPMAQVATAALDSSVHRLFSAAQGADRAGGRDSPNRQRGERAMRELRPLSLELEALLAPHRTVLPLAPSVEARVIARARGRGGGGRSAAAVGCPSGRGGCSRRRPAWSSPSARRLTRRARGWWRAVRRARSCRADRVAARERACPRLVVARRRLRRRRRSCQPRAAAAGASRASRAWPRPPDERGAGALRAARQDVTRGRLRAARWPSSRSTCASSGTGAWSKSGKPCASSRWRGSVVTKKRSGRRPGSTPGSRTACSSRPSNA